MPNDTIWEIEPHTAAKHAILRGYLGAWFAIMATWSSEFLYVDGFCGPGEYSGGERGSPIIALELALNHEALRDSKIHFHFIDNDQRRIDHLRETLANLSWPERFDVQVDCGEFETVFLQGYANRQEQLALPPTFAFLDPFGFSGLPFQLVQRILACRYCEVFINLSVDSINRFLDHPNQSITDHIVRAFGTDKVLQISAQEEDRVEAFRLLYQQQLRRAARYVRFFEMRDQRNHIPYYLFFATNHPTGFKKMKESMWRVDPGGMFTFSDRTDAHMSTLFGSDCRAAMAKLLREKFSGQADLECGVIREYVESRTPYLATHMKAGLASLEANGLVAVRSTRADGKPRKGRTFPDEVVVSFM